MNTNYNRIAGQSVERLAALSDGIFGVAMTLLLLELHVPDKLQIHSEAELRHALLPLLPNLLVYLMSFITLGIFWVGQQTQLNHLKSSERHLTWLHMAFLFAVTLLPFSTRLLVDFIHLKTALLAYWGNIFLLGLTLYACWGRAVRVGMVDDAVSLVVKQSICHRIIIAQSLYALGAALCFISNDLSIAVIALIQLNYAIAPASWKWKTAGGHGDKQNG